MLFYFLFYFMLTKQVFICESITIPLAVFVAHLHGALYKHVTQKLGNFTIQMSVSGPATGTGKSLWMTLCMLIFSGSQQPTSTTMTEAFLRDGRGRAYIW